MPALRILVVFGTRPEAIKLCPLITHLASAPETFVVRTCVTAQHRGMLDQVLAAFEVGPDHDLDLMRPGQTLPETTSRVVAGLERVIAEEKPDLVLVQGDTTTTFGAALAAFYAKVSVGHVEAGLRTADKYRPFPEEMNRVLTTRLGDLHFAATEQTASHLREEGVPDERIFVTGNTVIDAVLAVRDRLADGRIERPRWAFLDPARKLILVTAHRRESFGEGFEGMERPRWAFLDPARKLILVTAHRRESFGEGFEGICRALKTLAARRDVQIVCSVHPNPNVSDPVRGQLEGTPGVELLNPVGYVEFVDLMTRSYLILTDSGGIQEEAPSLGKPVLVMRENTERPEAVEAGAARLVGTNAEAIVSETNRLLDEPEHYQRMSRQRNPYGDGHACRRIAEALKQFPFKTLGSRARTASQGSS